MSKNAVVVYKNEDRIEVVAVRVFFDYAILKYPYTNRYVSDRDYSICVATCIQKHFATADGAFKWSAYIDEGIKQEEITEDIYNTIFMMNKVRK